MANIYGTDRSLSVEHSEKPAIDFYASADYFRELPQEQVMGKFGDPEFQRHVMVLSMALQIYRLLGNNRIGYWNNDEVFINQQGLPAAHHLVDAIIYDDPKADFYDITFIPKLLRQAEIIRYIRKKGGTVLE